MSKKNKPTTTVALKKPTTIESGQPHYARIVQNFLLIWLDENIDEINNEDCLKTIIKLRQVVNNVNTFTDVKKCIDFITDIKDEKAFIISSGIFGKNIVPIVHDKSQVIKIYIFCGSKARHEKWAHQWSKVKGVYTDITPIFKALEQATHNCDHNSISISFVKANDEVSNQNLDQLDQSFMYTQILKEILLTINFEQEHIDEFLTYCRQQLAGNTIELGNVDKIEEEYFRHEPIWWYTYQCFLYSMLNRALRTMEVDLIIKMGFFIQDLHNNITALHAEQYGENYHSSIPFTVYRGQGLSQTDFDQLKKTQHGLMSFNNFLSISLDRTVSFDFAKSNQQNSDLIGILFEITINPSIPSSTAFARIRDFSSFETEGEILFSMHSVFRIGQIKQIDENNNRLWQVDLTLTSDNDPHLHALTEHIREETFPTTKGWYRLCNLLIKLGQFDKAQQVYDIMLDQTSDDREKANIYHQLGWVKDNQEKYEEAIIFYERALEIDKKALPLNHPDLSIPYNNIGSVYDKMGQYSEAISFYEKALEIKQNTLPPNYSSLATSYSNIGSVYFKMGDNLKALSSHQKAFEIFQTTLPPNHPNLATSYNNIGRVYANMGEYSEALSYYEKDLEITRKTLPPDHPNLATSYNNIGRVYVNIGEYQKALSYCDKALEIRQKKLSSNHPDLATSYNNIAVVYDNMGDYTKALSFFKRAVDIGQNSLPINHPDLRLWKNNLDSLEKKL